MGREMDLILRYPSEFEGTESHKKYFVKSDIF